MSKTIGQKVRCVAVPKCFRGWFKPMPKVGWLYTIRDQKVITNQDGDTFLAYRLIGIEGRKVNGIEAWMEGWPFADPHTLYWAKGGKPSA